MRYALAGTEVSNTSEVLARAALARVLERSATTVQTTERMGTVELANFSSDGARLIAVNEFGDAFVIDAVSGERDLNIPHDAPILSASVSPDGTRLVAVQEDGKINFVDSSTGRTISSLMGHNDAVRTAKFSPDGSRLVTASDDGTARLWAVATGAEIEVLSGHTSWLTDAVFSPDGTRLLTTSADNTARLWDATTGRPISVLAGHADIVRSAAYSPDGRFVATGSQDHAAIIWDPDTGAEIRRMSATWPLISVAFSDDGTKLLANDISGNFFEWSVDNGRLIHAFDGQLNDVGQGIFRSDGTVFVGTSERSSSIVWEAASGRIIADYRSGSPAEKVLAFDREGTVVAVALSDGNVAFWNFSHALSSMASLRTEACEKIDAANQRFFGF